MASAVQPLAKDLEEMKRGYGDEELFEDEEDPQATENCTVTLQKMMNSPLPSSQEEDPLGVYKALV